MSEKSHKETINTNNNNVIQEVDQVQDSDAKKDLISSKTEEILDELNLILNKDESEEVDIKHTDEFSKDQIYNEISDNSILSDKSLEEVNLEVKQQHMSEDILLENEIETPESLNIDATDQQNDIPSYEPILSLFRNNNTDYDTYEFTPQDLITINIQNTGDWKNTKITMYDRNNEVRYIGISGGSHHLWTTRIQRTRQFGDWYILAEVPSNEENKVIDLNVSFKVLEQIDEIIELEDIIEEEIPPEVIHELEELDSIQVKVEIPIIEIVGIGPSYARKLNNANIYFFNDLLTRDDTDISNITNCSVLKVEGWKNYINQVLSNDKHELIIKYGQKSIERKEFTPLAGINDLPSSIKGIGAATEKKLIKLGYGTLKIIADANPEEMIAKTNYTEQKIIGWITFAQMKLYGDVKVVKPIMEVQTGILPNEPPSLIKGIGKVTERNLIKAGYKDILSISNAQPEEIAEKLGITISKSATWISSAQKMLGKEIKIEISKEVVLNQTQDESPLVRINGVGKTYDKRFREAGIYSLEEFRSKHHEVIAKIAKISVSKAKQWLEDAERLLGQ
ncbi:MAG: helix-hairpin-helix domain-containing protein [Candidatus Heimdallarchaeota archaeon]|nr:helix-hairpin-helix domain-containing protein [Candidatus Heimdallarchaeota archaeon]MDH5644569.1 helix-hairpin-helix domain-containing protein [Candidatus Heimdallarchaeota archaeon]